MKYFPKPTKYLPARGLDVSHHALYTNTKISDTSEIEDAIIKYAKKIPFKLIIMGTRGLSALNGLGFW